MMPAEGAPAAFASSYVARHLLTCKARRDPPLVEPLRLQRESSDAGRGCALGSAKRYRSNRRIFPSCSNGDTSRRGRDCRGEQRLTAPERSVVARLVVRRALIICDDKSGRTEPTSRGKPRDYPAHADPVLIQVNRLDQDRPRLAAGRDDQGP